MTYGFAIILVLAGISAMAYFGILSPSKLLPERCQFPAGMDCFDKEIKSETTVGAGDGTITVALKNNNRGFAILITNVEINNGDIPCIGTPQINNVDINPATPPEILNNVAFRAKLTGCALVKGDKISEDIIISYTNADSGLENQATGSVWGKVV